MKKIKKEKVFEMLDILSKKIWWHNITIVIEYLYHMYFG